MTDTTPSPPEAGLKPPQRKRRRWLPRRKPKKVKVNTSLRMMHEVLGLEHLHFGLWQGEPLDIDGLRRAQERYADYLCSWIPDGVRTVLDVGCGTGSTALKLREQGYQVEGLAPDPYLREIFVERTGLPFHLARFQDFRPERAYDLVLMSESVQYIWLDWVFPLVRRVAPDGHLLLADYFVVDTNGGRAAESGHPLDAFLERAGRYGFELLRREDVTEQTAPTLELASLWHDRYVTPGWRIVADSAASRHPFLFGLARRLFGRGLQRKVDDARLLWDAEVFRRVKRYELMLLKAGDTA